jgi:sterol 24-C-methyltransferase
METLVHADDPDQAMRGFDRVLKPGGVLVHHEYEHGLNDGQNTAWHAFNQMN